VQNAEPIPLQIVTELPPIFSTNFSSAVLKTFVAEGGLNALTLSSEANVKNRPVGRLLIEKMFEK
jgi:hypothetical protein